MPCNPRHPTRPPHHAEWHTTPRFWRWVGGVLARRPGTVGVAAVARMAPFAALAAVRSDAVSYDLTRNVPPGSPNADGLRAIREHFLAGATGPVTVLVRNDRTDFRTPEGPP